MLLAGVVVFGILAVAAVLVATRDSGVMPSPAAGPDAPPQAPTTVILGSGSAQVAAQGTPQVPGPQVRYGPPAPEPPADSWEAVQVAARASALGPVGGALGRGLNEIQPRIAACFDEDTQARHGQKAVSETKDYAPMPDYGTTVLMLQVETQAGHVRIVDAPVETRGTASDGLIACAQGVLRGRTFEAPGAMPGERHRLLYSLMP